MATEPTAKGNRRTLRVGKYDVQGSFTLHGLGTVNKAVDRELECEVLLRLLPPEAVSTKAALDRTQREAAQASRLQHENVLKVLDFGNAHGTWYLALEAVDGNDLHDHIDRKDSANAAQGTGLAVGDSLEITRQVARALEYLHQQELAHKNVRPATILMGKSTDRKTVKLIPPGLVATNRDESRAVASGEKVQSSDYSAPESAGGADRDIRSDIYSLGCTLFHMLTGRPPFAELLPSEREARRQQGEIPDLTRLNPNVPDDLARIMGRMLACKPRERYPTPTDLLKDLGAITIKPTPPARSKPAPKPSSPTSPPPSSATSSAQAVDDLFNNPSLLAGLAEGDETVPEKKKKRDDEETYALRETKRPAKKPPEKAPDEEVPRKPVDEPVRKSPPKKAEEPEPEAPKVKKGKYFEEPEEEKAPESKLEQKKILFIAVGIVAFLIAGIVITKVISSLVSSGDKGSVGGDSTPLSAGSTPRGSGGQGSTPPQDKGIAWSPPIYKLTEEPVKIRAELEKPWSGEAAGSLQPPKDAPVVIVSRVPAQVTDKNAKTFDSLKSACESAAAGKWTVVVVADNGPLYEPPIAVKDRKLWITAADGYRPLIVWDQPDAPAAPKGAAQALISSNAQLVVVGLEMAVKCQPSLGETAAFLKVSSAELFVGYSVFSTAGKPTEGESAKTGVAIARMEGDIKGKRCKLSQCFGRGSALSAVDIYSPGTDVMIERCLLVGDDYPLVQVTGHKDETTVRCIRSTFVAGKQAVNVRTSTGETVAPTLNWIGWDCHLCRAAKEPGGTMVQLPNNAPLTGIKWRPLNCLYSGWEKLLAGSETVSAKQLEDWQRRRENHDGDAVVPDVQKAYDSSVLGKVLPIYYFTAGTPFNYEATDKLPEKDDDKSARPADYNPGPIGFDPYGGMLPFARESWLDQTYDRLGFPKLELSVDKPPAIPTTADGKFHGERIDLNKLEANKSDLGSYLREKATKQAFAERIVLHLHGNGQVKMTPIALHKMHVTLYFEPSRDRTKPGLIILPTVEGNVQQDGFLQMNEGTLEVVGAAFQGPESKDKPFPHYLFNVQQGALRLLNCRLIGPWLQTPTNYWGLIGMAGMGAFRYPLMSECIIRDCVLETSKIAVHISGTGASLDIKNSVIVSLDDALHFTPVGVSNQLHVRCSLDSNTIAARRAVLRIDSARDPATHTSSSHNVIDHPVVIQSRNNAFLNPFQVDSKPAPVALMVYADPVLVRGAVSWQGDGDLFDRRLQSYAIPEGSLIKPPQQPHTLWTKLWGNYNNRKPHTEVPLTQTLDPQVPRLENLTIPHHAGLKDALPGANLPQLGIKKN